MNLLCFVTGYVNHRDLHVMTHSFPTRRSSDLGAIATALVAHRRDLGGLHSLADSAAHAGAYVDPIRTAYKGYDIYECPPNGQGIIALLLLNILAGFDLP